MKQIVQNYRTGKLSLEEVPVPICKPKGVLVRTAYSLVSTGTERMKVTQARMNLVQKAKARPDKVRQVIQTAKQVGIVETINKVKERLDALTPLGYSLAGTVCEVGAGIDEFEVGDLVACAGEGIACHAEYVFVPRNLCVPVPPHVEPKDAAFATVGAIALNGVRQGGVSLGDTVVVIGLGLVGLLAIQILKAAGCRVIGVDVDPQKIELAKICGADAAFARSDSALEDSIRHITGGIGADAIYIAASTSSSDPMHLAGRVVRDRGKIIIVGMVKIEADWQAYYDKELSVVMSRSYGPGRHDPNFEQKGIDYPIGYVRWSERRNLAEFIRLVGTKQINTALLDPEIAPLDDAPRVYDNINDPKGKSPIAVLFEYPQKDPVVRRVAVTKPKSTTATPRDSVGVGMIGAGNFATGTLVPALKKASHAQLRAICSAGGLTAKSAGRRHGFDYCASDYQELLNDKNIDAIVVATRHDTHATISADALRAGKHVFVEKPLALTREQLEEVTQAQRESGCLLMPGFNRRFSPLSIAVADFFAERSGPIEVICRVNAGALGPRSWYQDPDEGGWRIISEGCHFVDLIQFVCGCSPVRVFAETIGGDRPGVRNENCTVTLRMQDGSLGTLIYIANGDTSFEKERIEVFGQGRAAAIENWHAAKLCSGGKTRTVKPRGTGKGHALEMAAFIDAIHVGTSSPIPMEQAIACTLTTFAVAESLATGAPVTLELPL